MTLDFVGDERFNLHVKHIHSQRCWKLRAAATGAAVCQAQQGEARQLQAGSRVLSAEWVMCEGTSRVSHSTSSTAREQTSAPTNSAGGGGGGISNGGSGSGCGFLDGAALPAATWADRLQSCVEWGADTSTLFVLVQDGQVSRITPPYCMLAAA